MTVYAYVRVSTARQVSEGESLDVQQRQITRLRAHARLCGRRGDHRGRRVGSVPVGERPAGAALFAKLKVGDVMIAAKLDRLFRSALDALQVSKSCAPRA